MTNEPTFTQSDVEVELLDVLAGVNGTAPTRRLAALTVDVYLSLAERDRGRLMDRNAIPQETAFSTLATIVRDFRATD